MDIHSVHATSLPNSHPSFSLQQVLEMSDKWKARPIPEEPVQLFIGILSATNHFAERMAIRKTWMHYPAFQLGDVVARFFVALVCFIPYVCSINLTGPVNHRTEFSIMTCF